MQISKYCKPNITTQSICSPLSNDLWYKGTYNLITWEIAYPYYRIPKSPTLNIYFYYQEHYQYYHTVNFTNININDGYHVIYINDSFFPNNNVTNKKWEYMVIIVGNSTDPDKEINNIFSNFPKIDFYIMENNTSLSTSTFYTQSNTLNIFSTNSQSESSVKNGNTNIEIWKIVVIIICSIIFIIILFLSIFIYRKKRFHVNQYKESKNVEIIYEKPDLKDSRMFCYQKPNELD